MVYRHPYCSSTAPFHLLPHLGKNQNCSISVPLCLLPQNLSSHILTTQTEWISGALKQHRGTPSKNVMFYKTKLSDLLHEELLRLPDSTWRSERLMFYLHSYTFFVIIWTACMYAHTYIEKETFQDYLYISNAQIFGKNDRWQPRNKTELTSFNSLSSSHIHKHFLTPIWHHQQLFKKHTNSNQSWKGGSAWDQ